MKLISINAFIADFKATDEVTYHWGGKPPLTQQPRIMVSADCSGWLSWELVRRGYPQNLPRSSVEMRDWFLELADNRQLNQTAGPEDKPFYRPPGGLSAVCQYAKHDGGRLFIAGFDLGGTHRHIFSVLAAHTMECASGLHGVGSRDARDFIDEVDGGKGWIVEVPATIEA